MAVGVNQPGGHQYIKPRHDAEAIMLDSSALDQTPGLKFL
jgi:hypothetical protein